MYLARALLVWFVMMGVEFTHGALRTIFLAPLLGDFWARQVSVFTGSILIVLIAYLFIPWIQVRGKGALFLVGILWLGLTLVFEFSLGLYVFHRTWASLASDFNILEGGLFPIGLIVLALSPLLAAKLRRR